MGNCCCLTTHEKRRPKNNTIKKGHKSSPACHHRQLSKKSNYLYDEYENDLYNEDLSDFERHTTRSSLSGAGKSKNSLSEKNKKHKVLIDNHSHYISKRSLHNQQQQLLLSQSNSTIGGQQSLISNPYYMNQTSNTSPLVEPGVIQKPKCGGVAMQQANLLHLQQSHLNSNYLKQTINLNVNVNVNVNNNCTRNLVDIDETIQDTNVAQLLNQNLTDPLNAVFNTNSKCLKVDHNNVTNVNHASNHDPNLQIQPEHKLSSLNKDNLDERHSSSNTNINSTTSGGAFHEPELTLVDQRIDLNDIHLEIDHKSSNKLPPMSSSSSASISSLSCLESTLNSLNNNNNTKMKNFLKNNTESPLTPSAATAVDSTANSKKLSYRKRSNNLNQSLNETDLYSSNGQSSKCKKNFNRCKKQRKLDLTAENNNSSTNEIENADDDDDEDDEYNSDEALNIINKAAQPNHRNHHHHIGSNNYRSLQKSKRSIKTIEKTLKNSKSIERWLNDFDKLRADPAEAAITDEPSDKENQADHPAEDETLQPSVKKSSLESNSIVLPNDELYRLLNECHSSGQNLSCIPEETSLTSLMTELPVKLAEKLDHLIGLNSLESVRSIETDMYLYVKNFLLPKSLSNLEDINYLKWLLDEKNFSIFIQQPVFDANLNYNLVTRHLNIRLECEHTEPDHDDDQEWNEDDPYYLVYSPDKQALYLLVNKIKSVLNREKELAESSTLSNRHRVEAFRSRYVHTLNFKGAQSLHNICAKKIKKKQLNTFNSSTNSSSSSTSTSSSGGKNSLKDPANYVTVSYGELNDKLFLCFLSNFSCKLVDNFLVASTAQDATATTPAAGFIRKHNVDKSFSYINVQQNGRDTVSSKMSFSFLLRRWPSEYDFAARNKIAGERLLAYMSGHSCVLTCTGGTDDALLSDEDDDSCEMMNSSRDLTNGGGHTLRWRIDTTLAESILFKSFDKFRLFLYYFTYVVINNFKLLFDYAHVDANNVRPFNKRVLLHHLLRYFDLNQAVNGDLINTYEHLCRYFINFSLYLRFDVLNRYNSLNRPNYFNLNGDILNDEEQDEEETRQYVNEFAVHLVKCEDFFKRGARLYELNLELRFNDNRVTTPRRTDKNVRFNEYLLEFYQVLFEQFKSKRDNFKLNEQVLMDIHTKVMKKKHELDDDDDVLDLDVDMCSALLTKFELYAECVHKYLPQIRQHNQYLLFHYIWTMQVQYLAPFFNYICDVYKSYN